MGRGEKNHSTLEVDTFKVMLFFVASFLSRFARYFKSPRLDKETIISVVQLCLLLHNLTGVRLDLCAPILTYIRYNCTYVICSVLEIYTRNFKFSLNSPKVSRPINIFRYQKIQIPHIDFLYGKYNQYLSMHIQTLLDIQRSLVMSYNMSDNVLLYVQSSICFCYGFGLGIFYLIDCFDFFGFFKNQNLIYSS